MRLYLLGTVLFVLLIHCRANPIVTITADHDARSVAKEVEIEKEGIKQDETDGVFKKIDKTDGLLEAKPVSESEKAEHSHKDEKTALADKTDTKDVSDKVQETSSAEKISEKPKLKKVIFCYILKIVLL